MRPIALGMLLLFSSVSGLADEKTPGAKTHEIRLNGHTFTLPVGFEIVQVAGPPLVNRPIEADFDEQGRLYVSDSSGSNEPVQEQLEKKPHRIVRLEDTDGDGRFDKSTVFADKLMFPEGVMWYAGSLYVAAVPSIWKLTDTKGAGVADQRIEWMKGGTMTGCANDLHGPYLGPDGWIYWCKGAFAKQTYERPGKKPFVTRASHIFRCRPDGTGIEPVMTGGMDNPVEVAFTPGGERIFTTTFFQHPGNGQRDGLIHAVYGGIYGKDHDVIYDHPWTSPHLMPVLTHMGAAAPCGLIRYESDVFGPEYKDNLFACQFNMHKVSRHVLTPDGATFKSRDEDFLVSNNLDFHPTDVLEDADGSLLVIDTGGWYKLCCPTSQLHKPDILGAIYRVRKTGARKVEDPRGLKIAWDTSADELIEHLGDARPAVRKQAIAAVAACSRDDIVRLMGKMLDPRNTSALARRNAIWALSRNTRITDFDPVMYRALYDTNDSVRQVAIHAMSLRREHKSLELLLALCIDFAAWDGYVESDLSIQNRRAAAEAIGRIGDKSAVPDLLKALGRPRAKDRVLEHSLIYALIEIADREGTAAGLKNESPQVRRAALTALDQMEGGKLEAATVARELSAADSRLRETAWWIAGHHPEWGDTLAGFLRDRLNASNRNATDRDELVHHLARFAGSASIQKLLAERLTDSKAPRQTRVIVLQAMGQTGLKECPAAWVAAITKILASADQESIADAVTIAKSLHASKAHTTELANALLQVAHHVKLPDAVRLNALAAVPGGLASVEPADFTYLCAHLPADQPVANRSAAVDALVHAKLTTPQLLALAEILKTVGPMEVDRLLEAFAQSTDEQVGLAAVAALQTASARSAVRTAAVKAHLAKYDAAVQKKAEALYALLDADTAKQREKLEHLLTSVKGGDIRRGQLVFMTSKAACSSCHTIGYLGGKIGPDLTQIGKIRSERDLLESIVFPSASLVRSYEPMLVATKDGKTYNGLVRKDTAEEVVLTLTANQDVHIPRGEIEDIQPSKISIMPAGLDQQLSPQDLADLVAFLRACK
jgi:putative membrane-bound dehydrogenase-like protein